MKGKTPEEVEAELKAAGFAEEAIKKIKPHKVNNCYYKSTGDTARKTFFLLFLDYLAR